MDNIFNKISISLIILGVAFYAFAMTFTALIPSILGLLIQIVLFHVDYNTRDSLGSSEVHSGN